MNKNTKLNDIKYGVKLVSNLIDIFYKFIAKIENINDLVFNKLYVSVSEYRYDEFIDLCRKPYIDISWIRTEAWTKRYLYIPYTTKLDCYKWVALRRINYQDIKFIWINFYTEEDFRRKDIFLKKIKIRFNILQILHENKSSFSKNLIESINTLEIYKIPGLKTNKIPTYLNYIWEKLPNVTKLNLSLMAFKYLDLSYFINSENKVRINKLKFGKLSNKIYATWRFKWLNVYVLWKLNQMQILIKAKSFEAFSKSISSK